jgi:NTE family protein
MPTFATSLSADLHNSVLIDPLSRRRLLHAAGIALLLAACKTAPVQPPSPPAEPAPVRPLRIGLALGGGAARGFAHVGVIKSLEAQGVPIDIVVGTSAGSVVGALYAGGFNGFELHRLALSMEEATVADWSLPSRGVLKGEALQTYINTTLKQRPIEKLDRKFAAVATDLQSGEMIVFERGNTGMAVRASSSVPAVFQPVAINGREYVDGGLVSPVPVRVARRLGADVVIAVDISNKPAYGATAGTFDVLMQTVAIMVQSIAAHETTDADIVIRPELSATKAADFAGRNLSILEGEKAAAAASRQIAEAIGRTRARLAQAPASAPAR